MAAFVRDQFNIANMKQFLVAKFTHLLSTLTLSQWYSLCLDENPLALLSWVVLLITVLPSEMYKGDLISSNTNRVKGTVVDSNCLHCCLGCKMILLKGSKNTACCTALWVAVFYLFFFSF